MQATVEALIDVDCKSQYISVNLS